LIKEEEDALRKEKCRLVVDFRKQNAVAIRDSYSLPLI
jgi:hypothetical protein